MNVYFHINPVRNEVFYVGIGDNYRPFKKKNRSVFWNDVVKKYGYVVDVIERDLTKEQAIEREMFYINKIGRRDLGKGTLVNLTNGGEGQSGCTGYWTGKKRPKATDETKRKCRENSAKHWLGHKMSDVTKEKLRMQNIGKKYSDETNAKKGLSGIGNNWNVGKKLSESTRKKIALANTGKKRSPEQRKNMSGRIISQTQRDAMSKKLKGRIITPEWRSKISKTLKERWIKINAGSL